MLKFTFIENLTAAMRSAFSDCVLPADWTIQPERCPEGMDGDLTINCFRFAKNFRMAPDKVAEKVAELLTADPGVAKAQVVKAFVNVTLNPESLYADTLCNLQKLFDAARVEEKDAKRILVEYSAPNTNKPQHLGHVRNNTLGMSLSSLLKRAGHTVFQVNLVNDRGIHICKSMIAYQRFGNGETPESTGMKGDHLVGKYYVEYNKALGNELKALRAEHPEFADRDDESLFLETELGRATQKMLQDWENNDPEVRALWKMMNSWVFAGFEQTYQRMGIHFDHTYLESETYLLGKDIVRQGLEGGVFARREDGAVFADLGKLGKKVVLRSDGTSVYITQDIGTTIRKAEDYNADSQIWVVGDEQNLHFQMLFAILKKLGYSWADSLFHLSYGMVNLPSGKMKSREGTVVDADDLFDEMVSLARESCAARNSDGAVDDATLAARAEMIGMGALKFMLLKFNAKTTMMFDPQASIKFEGDTGPYVQYAVTRVKSIVRKAEERGIHFAADEVNWSLLSAPEEKELAVRAYFYPSVIQAAAERRDCSALVDYLLDFSKAFNRFYRECPVLSAENEELQKARLAMADAAGKILADGLATLTIDVPDAM